MYVCVFICENLLRLLYEWMGVYEKGYGMGKGFLSGVVVDVREEVWAKASVRKLMTFSVF